jgi:hypothetical protein
MTIAVLVENMIHVKSFVQGSYQAFLIERRLDKPSFVASQNKLLQSYVDRTVTITPSFQPHLPLHASLATVDGGGGDGGMDR